jgi:hypothetical protein
MYDKHNEAHRLIKKKIEEGSIFRENFSSERNCEHYPRHKYFILFTISLLPGDGLPDMATQDEVLQALKSVGFEVRRPRASIS